MSYPNVWLQKIHVKNALTHIKGKGQLNLSQLVEKAMMLQWPTLSRFTLSGEQEPYQRARVLAWVLSWGIAHLKPSGKSNYYRDDWLMYIVLNSIYLKGQTYDQLRAYLMTEGDVRAISTSKLQNKRSLATTKLYNLLTTIETLPQSKLWDSLSSYLFAQRYNRLDESTQTTAYRLAVLRRPIRQSDIFWNRTWQNLLTAHLVQISKEGAALHAGFANFLRANHEQESAHDWAANHYAHLVDSAENQVEQLYHLQQAHAWIQLATKFSEDWVKLLQYLDSHTIQTWFTMCLSHKLPSSLEYRLRVAHATFLQKHVDIDAAIQQFEQLIFWAAPYQAANIHFQLAKAHRTKNDHGETLHHFASSIAILQTNLQTNPTWQILLAEVLVERAHYLIRDQGDFEGGGCDLDYIEQELSYIDSAKFQAEFHRVQGTRFGRQNQFDQSVQHFWRAWEATKRTKDPHLKVLAQYNLGLATLWFNQTQPINLMQSESCVAMLKAALYQAVQLKELRIEGACLKTIGDHYSFAKEYGLAVEYYQRALHPIHQLADSNLLTVTYVDYIEALCLHGDILHARSLYDEVTTHLAGQPELQKRLSMLAQQFYWLTTYETGLNERQQKAYYHALVHRCIRRPDYIKLTGCSARQASLDLKAMVDSQWLVVHGKGRATRYCIPSLPASYHDLNH